MKLLSVGELSLFMCVAIISSTSTCGYQIKVSFMGDAIIRFKCTMKSLTKNVARDKSFKSEAASPFNVYILYTLYSIQNILDKI